jgi:hypothetical protein
LSSWNSVRTAIKKLSIVVGAESPKRIVLFFFCIHYLEAFSSSVLERRARTCSSEIAARVRVLYFSSHKYASVVQKKAASLVQSPLYLGQSPILVLRWNAYSAVAFPGSIGALGSSDGLELEGVSTS